MHNEMSHPKSCVGLWCLCLCACASASLEKKAAERQRRPAAMKNATGRDMDVRYCQRPAAMCWRVRSHHPRSLSGLPGAPSYPCHSRACVSPSTRPLRSHDRSLTRLSSSREEALRSHLLKLAGSRRQLIMALQNQLRAQSLCQRLSCHHKSDGSRKHMTLGSKVWSAGWRCTG